jgi:divalent metal cation (Fe/Co/Zn/Cd) transporter
MTVGYARLMAVRAQTPVPLTRVDTGERARLERQARLLAWGGNAWHIVEFAIAVGAGIAAGSIALVAFGVDSLIEVAAGLTLVWRFS